MAPPTTNATMLCSWTDVPPYQHEVDDGNLFAPASCLQVTREKHDAMTLNNMLGTVFGWLLMPSLCKSGMNVEIGEAER